MSIIGSNILAGASGQAAGGGYAISRSLRFNSNDSAYLSRTPASAGNRKTWTWAGWVKRSGLAGNHAIFGEWDSSGIQGVALQFLGTDKLRFYDYATSSADWSVDTAQVFRDPSAWYHLVFTVDTTQATASNRIRIYVNGSQATLESTTYPSQNLDTRFNRAQATAIGRGGAWNNYYFPGYLADIHFIDGQALDPTSFGEFDATTGVWVPKAYTGTYGTNGFHLEFADNSSNTATTLGKDTSGNGNNWTPNNLSVTAGAGNDSLVDVPTNGAQTDTGAGGEVRGNYATLNPLQNASADTFSDGNLQVVTSSANYGTHTSTIATPLSGKWYAEATVGSASSYSVVGLVSASSNFTATSWPGSLNGVSYYGFNGQKIVDTSASSYGATFGNGDVIGIAYDADSGSVTFYKNGVSQGAITSVAIRSYYFAGSDYDGSGSVTYRWNFGQRPFAYTAPSGFKALNTANLPAPVVTKPSTVFDTKLYTGNGSTQTISGLGFSPNLVWIKGRSGATDHALYDTVRGVQQQLESNTTTDETTESTGLTAFNSDGFALGALAQANTSSATYAAWCWDESVSAGFDIVTYTGNGSARTISHSLGVAPSLIIVKARTTASTDQGWPVYHSANTAAPATDYLLLNSTAATADLDTVWNDTAPTSSVFSVGTNALVNANNDTYVAYLWAPVDGYSSFGSYTGNGSTDGPFVYTGFRSRWVLVKRTSSTGDWWLYDTARNTYNVMGSILYPNISDAEFVDTSIFGKDILSNGFKVRTSNGTVNGNGSTYIYAAFAESCFALNNRAR